MKRFFCIVILTFIIKISIANALVLCFKNEKSCVSLFLTGDEWMTGKAVYCNNKQPCELKQKRYISIKNYTDYPSVFLIQWNEYIAGKKVGFFIVELQGTYFYNAYYFNLKTRKKSTYSVHTIAESEVCK